MKSISFCANRQFVAPDGDDRNVIFTNAEEEVFIPECDFVLDMETANDTTSSSSSSAAASSSRYQFVTVFDN